MFQKNDLSIYKFLKKRQCNKVAFKNFTLVLGKSAQVSKKPAKKERYSVVRFLYL